MGTALDGDARRMVCALGVNHAQGPDWALCWVNAFTSAYAPNNRCSVPRQSQWWECTALIAVFWEQGDRSRVLEPCDSRQDASAHGVSDGIH